jgi:hypothetical protein
MMPPINCARVCEWFMFGPIVDTSSIMDYSIPLRTIHRSK